jgi:hypothetical protein
MRILLFLVLGLAAVLALAWTTSFVTKTGVLTSAYTPYFDEVFDIDGEEMIAAGAPTYGPMGMRCTYLESEGTRDVFFVRADDYEYLRDELASGGDVADWVRNATIVQTEDQDIECPFTDNFAEAR